MGKTDRHDAKMTTPIRPGYRGALLGGLVALGCATGPSVPTRTSDPVKGSGRAEVGDMPSPPANPNATVPCAQSPVRARFERGDWVDALGEIRSGSLPSVACPSEEERKAFITEILLVLGECAAVAAERSCIPNERLEPLAALERVARLDEEGRSEEAQRLLERARYAAQEKGHETRVVPSWLTQVESISRFSSHRLVVLHAEGTSVFDERDMSEVVRCAHRAQPYELMNEGRLAYLRERDGLLSLDTCEIAHEGRPLAASPDGSRLALLHDGRLRVTSPDSEEGDFERRFPVGETQSEVKGACFSQGGDELLIARGFGSTELISIPEGKTLWKLDVPLSRSISNHEGTMIDPYDRRCEFSPDGSRVTLAAAPGAGLLGISFVGPWVIDADRGSLADEPTGSDFSKKIEEWTGLPQERVMALLSRGRTFSGPQGEQVSVQELEKKLPVALSDSPSLRFHLSALCAGHRCFFEEGQLLYRPGIDDSEMSSSDHVVSDLQYLGRIDVERGLRINDTGIYQLPWKRIAAWQFPKDAQKDARSGKPVVTGAAWGKDGDVAWILIDTGRMFAFSTQTGRLVEEVEFDGADACLPSSGWVATAPRMADAPDEGLLLVRLAGKEGCTFLVDTQSGTTRPVPLSVPEDFVLSPDGRHLVTDADGRISSYLLSENAKVSSFQASANRISVSDTGEFVVGMRGGYYEEMPGGYVHNHPGSVWYRTKTGKEAGTALEFPHDPYRDEETLRLEASGRLVAHENRLMDYTGRQVAVVQMRERTAVVRYTDGSVEVFGKGRDAIKCLVGGQPVPHRFCQSKIVKGRLAELLGGLPTNRADDERYADRPLPARCEAPIRPCGEPVSTDIDEIHCSSRDTVDSSELACLGHPRNLNFDETNFDGFASDQNFRDLESLSLDTDRPIDLSPLRAAPQLGYLRLRGAFVKSLDVIDCCRHLTQLDVSRTAVKDLGPLAAAAQLRDLDLSRTNVTDLTPLSRLQHLESLDISDTKVLDLSPLAKLPQLKKLRMLGLRPKDVSPLLGVTGLEVVEVNVDFLTASQLELLAQAGLEVVRIYR